MIQRIFSTKTIVFLFIVSINLVCSHAACASMGMHQIRMYLQLDLGSNFVSYDNIPKMLWLDDIRWDRFLPLLTKPGMDSDILFNQETIWQGEYLQERFIISLYTSNEKSLYVKESTVNFLSQLYGLEQFVLNHHYPISYTFESATRAGLKGQFRVLQTAKFAFAANLNLWNVANYNFHSLQGVGWIDNQYALQLKADSLAINNSEDDFRTTPYSSFGYAAGVQFEAQLSKHLGVTLLLDSILYSENRNQVYRSIQHIDTDRMYLDASGVIRYRSLIEGSWEYRDEQCSMPTEVHTRVVLNLDPVEVLWGQAWQQDFTTDFWVSYCWNSYRLWGGVLDNLHTYEIRMETPNLVFRGATDSLNPRQARSFGLAIGSQWQF